MRIAIIGAGVGGLAAARGLIAAGHDVTVYERAGELRTGGTGLILWSNGTGVLKHLGVDVSDLGSPLTAVNTVFSDGLPLWRVDLDRIHEHYALANTVVPRGDIVRRLAASIPDSALRLGADCIGFDEDTAWDGPVVHFADGSSDTVDLLIGADGNRSVIRRQLVGAEPPAYTGIATWHGLTPIDIEMSSGTEGLTMYGPEGFSVLLPAGGGRLQWVFETPWTDGELLPRPADGSGDTTSVVGNLRSRFAHWADPVPDILAAIDDSDVGLFPHLRLRVPPRWSRGRVTIVGDAVHAIPPALAQGVNQVLEDVWVLCRELAATDSPNNDVKTRLKAYEDICARRLRNLDRYASVMSRGAAPPRFLRHTPFPVTWVQILTLRMLSDYLRHAPSPEVLRV